MARKHRTKTSVDSSSPRKKRSVNSKPITFKKMEAAKEMAYNRARLKKRMIVHTQNKSYQVLRQISEGIFGYVYEVKENEGGTFFLKTEPRTTDKDMERFKGLKYEMYILLKLSNPPYSRLKHMLRFQDSGATDDFKFLIMQPLGENLHDISRIHLKSEFSMSTAIRTAIQTLQAVAELHIIGFLHRSLGPKCFFVGAGTKMRTIYMGDFGFPYIFRNSSNGKIRKPRSYVPMMGVLNYMSRATHNDKEHCRRDDLESWAYMVMEFFDLEILPWNKCQIGSEVLRKKEKLIDGDYSSVFEAVPSRFKQILRYISNLEFCSRPNYSYIQDELHKIHKVKKIDIKGPYDWEVLIGMREKLEPDPIANQIPGSRPLLAKEVLIGMREKLEPDPIANQIPGSRPLIVKSPVSNSSVHAKPKNEGSREESAHSPNPASTGEVSIRSECSNEQDTPPKAAINQGQDKVQIKPIASAPTENDKSEYFIPMAERRILPERPEKSEPRKKKGDDEGGY